MSFKAKQPFGWTGTKDDGTPVTFAPVTKRDPTAEAQARMIANLVLGNMLTLGLLLKSKVAVGLANYEMAKINDPVEWEKLMVAVLGPR